MKCSNPIPSQYHGLWINLSCRQCLSCRINKQREWTARIMLESLSAAHSTFITLTYRDEDLPDPPNIKKEHAVAWQKQFRIKLARQYSLKCRFYTIGEYGGKKGRPHYHAIIFGPSHLISEEISLKAWPYGFIKASPMLPTHAAYVARYTTKKLQKSKATSYGAPEFAIMSRKPAIGSAYTETIAAELKNRLTSGTLTVSELQESLYRVAIQGYGGLFFSENPCD